MRIDPELDAVVKTPGICTSCGVEIPSRHVKVNAYYCPKCVALSSAHHPQEVADPARIAQQELAARELARRRFLPYLKYMNPRYQAGWFHQDLAARLERFVDRAMRGEMPRLIVNTPPRHGKSEQVSRGLPSWLLGKYPDRQIIAATHSDKLAMDNSRDVLNLIKDERYQALFPGLALDKDNKGAMGWRTTDGGKYKPVGVGAGVSGYGAHVLIVDDPHRDKDAFSETVRDSIWRWYNSSAKTRVMDGGGIVIVQTRWHFDDLTGRVLEDEGRIEDGGKWEVVSYPAVAEHDEYRLPNGRVISLPHPDATRLRKKGEPLDPKRYPLRILEQYRRDPQTWAALYQQNPTAGDAALITEGLLAMCACTLADIPERLAHYVVGDLAVTQKETSDYSVFMDGGVDEHDVLWICDVNRARFDAYDIVEELIRYYRTLRPEFIGVEKTNHTVGLRPILEKTIEERRLYGMVVEDLEHGNKDKVMRAGSIIARMRQGKVRIPTDAPWYEDFKQELLHFPVGRFDDQVDCFAYLGQILETMTAPRALQAKKPRSWQDKVAAHLRGHRRRSWRTA